MAKFRRNAALSGDQVSITDELFSLTHADFLCYA
jgi:hypothetical protein